MGRLPTIFETCKPRPEVLAGELPDALFAADLWDVITNRAHPDYQDARRFFAGTHPTENLRFLVREVAERLAGMAGGNPVFRLETGFGGGKTHSLIATVHVAQQGAELAQALSGYGIRQFPKPNEVRVAAFVGDEADPLGGNILTVDGQQVPVFTPWGQLALLSGGLAGYERMRENDVNGVAPARSALEEAMGDASLLVLIDELVLYMARALALPEGHARKQVNTQWATFIPSLFSIAARRPRTAVIVTLPSEQDANRRLAGELKQYVPSILETVDELAQSTGRQVRNLTPTQPNERAAVLARRLFEWVDASRATDIAKAYMDYYQEQRAAGVVLEDRAFGPGYADEIRTDYPFHPELVRLFADRLAEIPEFQATRGALRLVARTIRTAWAREHKTSEALLLQPHHIDLASAEMRDEVLARLGKSAFERGLAADVVRPEGGTHAADVEKGWPWRAATESSLAVFLHSLPGGSRGLTAGEAALAVGRPGWDLAYVATALEETERRAWYMRREGDYFLFRTRASINKRFQERLTQVLQEPAVVRETIDAWVREVYSGFRSFQVIPFPLDQTAIPDTGDKVRLVIVHYDKECGQVGAGNQLSFAKQLFTKSGVQESPRRYRNNIVFLLAEATRAGTLKDAVRSLIAWERVKRDIEIEQAALAQAAGADYQATKDAVRRGASGVPQEFMALENDLQQVHERLGTQELNVRSRLLDAYRVLAFPQAGARDMIDLFSSTSVESRPLLECYRVEFGDNPDAGAKRKADVRQAVAEGPILECLRSNGKLVGQHDDTSEVVLAPEVLKRPPVWRADEKAVSTEEVWDRLRREPEAPMLIRDLDLLPTFRAGLNASPDALWVYYDQGEKRLYSRANATQLSPVLKASHYLYDPKSASQDRVIPVVSLSPQEVWECLWPTDGAQKAQTTTAEELRAQAAGSAHFPVLPELPVIWQALRDGVRENRWVLYLRDQRVAIGSAEMNEWPRDVISGPMAECWTYEAALSRNLYPRSEPKTPTNEKPTPANLVLRCWPPGMDKLDVEDFERLSRGVWYDLSREHLRGIVREGIENGTWAIWRTGADGVFYTKSDANPQVEIGPQWVLVRPDSALARSLEDYRPGRGPAPIEEAGTPREALTHAWDKLAEAPGARVQELLLSVRDRHSLDNTLQATFADRPKSAAAQASIIAKGRREVMGETERVEVSFDGRFEEVRALLAPIWGFASQGELDLSVTLRVALDPPVSPQDERLCAYKTALMNANQGSLEVRIVRVRGAR